MSYRVAEALRLWVSDVVHVGERGLASAPDEVVLQLALAEGRVVLSRDQDFGNLLAARKLLAPSFVLLRPPTTNRTDELVELLRRVLDEAADDLHVGAVVTVQGERIRTRRLPLSPTYPLPTSTTPPPTVK